MMHGSHDYQLVVLSVVISIAAAYAARALSDRIRDASGTSWIAWLAGGAIADGIATWSMHYTGMLAFNPPIPVLYDWPTVLASLIVSIIGSWLAFSALRTKRITWLRVVFASFSIGGIGISGLHYVAMGAMRMQAAQHHSHAVVLLATTLAIVISFIALTFSGLIQEHSHPSGWKLHSSAILRGAANPIMHYTAMAGMAFLPSAIVPDLSHAVSIWSIGIIGISIVPVMVLIVSLLVSFIDRLQKQKGLLRVLSSRIENLREDERTRMSREIHDELGQKIDRPKNGFGLAGAET